MNEYYSDFAKELKQLHDKNHANCKYIEILEGNIDRLAKALDKACEELSRLNNDLDRRVITTSTYWKERLLKEVQEDE